MTLGNKIKLYSDEKKNKEYDLFIITRSSINVKNPTFYDIFFNTVNHNPFMWSFPLILKILKIYPLYQHYE